MTAFILHSVEQAFSSAFSDTAATWRKDSSSALDDDTGEDVYEMALEVLEGDEAYRLESSGSISPESDVDRLLENADAERFSGDVTLIRVFSIQRDADGGEVRSGDVEDRGQEALGLTVNCGVTEEEPDFRRFSNMDEMSPTDEQWLSDVELYIGETETESEASAPAARRTQQALDSVDLVSVDLHSNSSSTVGLDEDLSGPTDNGDRCFAECGLVCGATFSNVKSKDALIRTSLTVNPMTPGQRTSPLSCQEPEGLRTPESEDISLHMTSSDSLYSTDDCFCDSSFPDASAGGRPFPAPSFSRREPSPEDLFDLALESRSDLGGSSIGSSSFYDAVQCSPSTCIHRDPSPEEAFDLALESLSDVIDDDSSSVFVIAPRTSIVSKRPGLQPDLRPGLRPDPRPDQFRPTVVRCRTAYDVENARSKMADEAMNSGSPCALCGRRRCYARGETKGFCCNGRSSSCEAIVDEDQVMRGTIGGSSSIDLLTDSSDWEARCCCCRRPKQEMEEPNWSSDPCPSSPEPSILADYSTDDCVGGETEEEEEDSSVTDCDGIDPSSSLRTDFFLRLLRRRRTDLSGTSGRTKDRTREEDRLLDEVQICSIEDLMTDSDFEGKSWNLKARGTTGGLELQLKDGAPMLSLFRDIQGRIDGRADEPSDQEVCPVAAPVVVGPIQPLSPPIAQSVRTDVQYARKSKIPKLPESRTTMSPVRVSW